MGIIPYENRSKILKELSNKNPDQLRPILTNLNGDNSWLISLPRPSAGGASNSTPNKTKAKAYFHILQDAWLSGPSISGGFKGLIANLTHAVPGRVSSVAQVRDLIAQIESSVV